MWQLCVFGLELTVVLWQLCMHMTFNIMSFWVGKAFYDLYVREVITLFVAQQGQQDRNHFYLTLFLHIISFPGNALHPSVLQLGFAHSIQLLVMPLQEVLHSCHHSIVILIFVSL